MDELIKENSIELPEGLVVRRLERLVHQVLEDYQRRGVTQDQQDPALEDSLRKELAGEARRQIHLVFLLDEIANQQKIDVTEQDLKARYGSLALRMRRPAEEIEKYYSEHEEASEALEDKIRNEKAIQFLKDNNE